jgi:hypothetical protein
MTALENCRCARVVCRLLFACQRGDRSVKNRQDAVAIIIKDSIFQPLEGALTGNRKGGSNLPLSAG